MLSDASSFFSEILVKEHFINQTAVFRTEPKIGNHTDLLIAQFRVHVLRATANRRIKRLPK